MRLKRSRNSIKKSILKITNRVKMIKCANLQVNNQNDSI